MAGRNIRPFRFSPRSVVDALDGGQVAPGGCALLSDLIFDPSTPMTMQCRPGAVDQYDFTDLTTPGVVSVAYVVGTICYGMIGSGLVSTYDQPFAYDLVNNVIVSMSGTMTSATLPLTQSYAGDWTPPTMALVGPILYITHPGFTGSTAFFAWIDTTNPAAPVYYSGNTATRALPSVPTAVAQYDDRAWLVCGDAINFTDAGNTTPTISDPAGLQTLIVGDSVPITALASVPIQTNVQGIIQSLVVFKPAVMASITGTYTAGTLTINILPSSIGTIAPRTVVSTPKGIMFMAADGIRTFALDGTVKDPNPDLKVPFISAIFPSMASAGYNNNIYRISVNNGNVANTPNQEYWLDIRNNGWTGPHTFTQQMCCAYGGTFVAFNTTIGASLFTSDVIQSGTSVFIEGPSSNQYNLSWVYQTAPMSDDGGLYENSAILSVIDMSLPTDGATYNFVAVDVDNGILATATITAPASGTLWGSFTWGVGLWTSVSYGMDRYNIPWNNTLTFSRLCVQANGASEAGVKIGKLMVGYQPLKYVRVNT